MAPHSKFNGNSSKFMNANHCREAREHTMEATLHLLESRNNLDDNIQVMKVLANYISLPAKYCRDWTKP